MYFLLRLDLEWMLRTSAVTFRDAETSVPPITVSTATEPTFLCLSGKAHMSVLKS